MPNKLFTCLFICFGTIILLLLGQWQLDRLVWKKSILLEIESKISGLPQSLPSDVKETIHKYMPIQLSGKIKGSFRAKVLELQKKDYVVLVKGKLSDKEKNLTEELEGLWGQFKK